MELPSRARGDQSLPPGAMLQLRERLRRLAPKHDLATVIAYAFDLRTRILPFIYADMKMAPAGVRAIGSAMVDSGFKKTRIVLQQWNRNVQPSQMRLDGRIPDLLLISSMQLHGEECVKLVRDACRLEPSKRPLIVAGGPLAIYQPWELFSSEDGETWGADIVVTGEEYVFLSLLEAVLDTRAEGESVRDAFLRARDNGSLDGVPGLVYRVTDRRGATEELVDTGVQRLLTDLDELPHPVLGYKLLEPPSSEATLGLHAIPTGRVRKYSPVSSLVMTFGCKFRCAYCPIPAYNQRMYRAKSGERLSDEFERIVAEYNIRTFFGTDDNFFNDQRRTMEIVGAINRRIDQGSRPLRKIRWATEATIHDTLKLRDDLPAIRRAGMTAVWMGVEDITASLVRKGQSEDKTLEAFRLLRENGIFPVPMLMHHDEQPLFSLKGNYGLINQLRVLRKAGAMYMQVLMLVPSPGSKLYAGTYTSGMAYESVNGATVVPHISDGNYVIASRHSRPWVKQLNILLGYTYFFNPLRLAWALIRPKSRIPLADADTSPEHELAAMSRWKRFRRTVSRKLKAHTIDALVQVFGMWGLVQTYRRTLPWGWNLLRGKVVRRTEPPHNRVPMRSVQGDTAPHALPGSEQLTVLELPEQQCATGDQKAA